MDVRDAAEAFVAGWVATRRLKGPFEAVPRGEATWLHDPRGARMGELVGVDLPPERLVALYPEGERGAISAIHAGEVESPKRAYRALGWRLLKAEPLFVHPLRDLPPLDPRVRRVVDEEGIARVAKHARRRPDTMGFDEADDADMRLYEAQVEGEHAGWVRSVRTGQNAWVSSLNVQGPFRRRGLGSGLMAALLHDDARLGRRASVLLASNAGALLYPRLGYERVGTLLLLMRKKEA